MTQPPGLPPPPGYYPGPAPHDRPDHPESTKALVLGIVALAGGFACYLPLLVGPWAWAIGRRVVREIDAEPGRFEGRSQAQAGYVLGVVATVLLVLGLVALGLLLVLFVAATPSPEPPLPGRSL